MTEHQKRCLECKKEFVDGHANKRKYCSDNCKTKAYLHRSGRVMTFVERRKVRNGF